ncbi:flavin-containing amine oxidase [Penicillium angulare]|uniref:flavin-containing amine oxidase n=1 Tax=Penicillium angulare TaxID=116970 RepID=UPI0025418C0A|nr:flavin-containing amine oxidase [Penicillium angulare]KAJ5281276.1 flavin-containing amine oxidase [Penicillium angulare]
MRYQVHITALKSTQTIYDVIVIGAGLSGLQAARSVRAAGLKVCVLEATNRVGGKTLSVQSCENGFNDLGAAWINDTNQSEMFKLFQRYNIDGEIQRASGDDVVLLSDGTARRKPFGQVIGDQDLLLQLLQLLRKESALVDLDNPASSPDAENIDKLTFGEFCTERTQTDAVITIADEICTALLGVQSQEVSALYMLHYIKGGCGIDNLLSDQKDGGQYLRNRKGNQTISKNLAQELGANAVFLRTPVTSIDQTGPVCIISTDPGKIFHCRKVIVSVPTTLYNSITFNPPLPTKKAILCDNAVMGYYSKMIFVFKEPWWQTGGFSGIMDCEKGPVTFTRDTSVPEDGQWSITCFIVGDRGREWSKLSRASRQKQVWGQITQAFGSFVEDVPEPSNVLEMEWAKQAFFLGAPCPVMTPGTLTSVGDKIATPFGNVHFVGTETAQVWRGYMEGAVRSGQRGGAEVVKALSNSIAA